MDLDRWPPSMCPPEPLVHPYLLSHISTSFVDNSLHHHSRYFYMSASLAIQDAFDCMSNYTGALLLSLASCRSYFNNYLHSLGAPNTSSCKSHAPRLNHIVSATHNTSILGRTFRFTAKSCIPVFYKLTNPNLRKLCEQPEQLRQSISMLSLAAALVPSLDHKVSIKSENMSSVQLEKEGALMQSCTDQSPCKVEYQGCDDLCFTGKLDGSTHRVEPSTGIEFPTVLDNNLARETKSSRLSEVLVGTGSRTMKIIKIKSLKVYAFGFYVHPCDVCEKLGSKYSSITSGELYKHHSFYQDLLREDISMTVRLVVRVNGIKLSTVRNAFEKSLQARLIKTNPSTDLDCLRRFGSLFSQDAPIRAGTTIYFKRTGDGHLITEIGGHQIGAVHSRDLCRAFFDMYIGDVPVCAETKDEIGRNVATILGHC